MFSQKWLGIINPKLLIKLAFHLWPGRDFLVFRGERLNRRAVYAQIKALAAGLSALGVAQGDRVAVFLPACPEAVYAQFLNSHLGTIHMPLNPLLGEQELREILNHSQAKVILTYRNWLGMQQATILARLKPALPYLQYIVVVANESDGTSNLPEGYGILSYKEVLAKSRVYPKIRIRSTDPTLLSYTSGTTGQPKGVIHSYARNWAFGTVNIKDRLNQQALECLLLPYPPYHFAGMFGIVVALISGGKVILMDRVDPTQMLAAIPTEKVTQIGAPPTIFRLLLSAAQNSSYDLSSVRRLTFSSEAMSPALARSLYDLFHCRLENFYGTTEAHLISWTSMEGTWQLASNSVGWPLPGVEVRIVDQARRTLPAGEVGEIVVRTPQMMIGYYRDPERTAQVLDADGWFYTGDAGFFAKDGSLCITGRLAELINRGGEKVYPEEVEVFLESHPAIRRAAIIGVPNQLSGQEILAFIVPRPGATIDLEEVLRFCRGKLAPFKTPSDICLVAKLPTTPNGKVQRNKLRENPPTPLQQPLTDHKDLERSHA